MIKLKTMFKNKKEVLLEGLKDGIPIALGYFAVSFSLGVFASSAGLSPIQGTIASLLTNASAGEYAGFMVIASNASYLQMITMTIIASARYLLMSTALTQKCPNDLNIKHRLLLSFYITDEIFGITVARDNFDPYYTYGAVLPATSLWALGTLLGIVAGNILPGRIVSALSVALYGMFLAIIIPPVKKDKNILIGVVLSFALSFLCTYYLPYIKDLSSGTRTIILTVILSSLMAVMAPRKEEDNA